MAEKKKKKSIVRKTISRKIQTASFEQLDVVVEAEEEIEWSSPKERMEKTEKVTQVLLIDFVDTFNKTVDELGVERQIGKVTSSKVEPQESVSAEHDFDILSD